MTKQSDILSGVKEAALSVDPSSKVFLFGSRSRDDYRENSDWDFLILTGNKATEPLKRKIRDRVFEVQLNLDAAITCIIYSKHEWKKLEVTPLYKNVVEDGISV